MSLNSLRWLMPVPAQPIHVPTAADWSSAEQVLGTRLPAEYKSFLSLYGSGRIDGFFGIFSPASPNAWENLLEQLERQRGPFETMQRGRYPVSLDLYPATPGLLPLAQTDNGDLVFYVVAGDPDRWTIAVLPSRAPDLVRFELGLVAFLLQARLLDVFPTGILEARAKFEPSPREPMTLRKLYAALGLRPEALQFAEGKLVAELGPGVVPGASVVGYPPAFVPIVGMPDSTLLGWWVDPFERRATTIVECSPTRGHRVVERFRTWDQLAFQFVVRRIDSDGADSAHVLADALGVDHAAAARVAAADDRARALREVASFESDPPRQVAPSDYGGDWPFPERRQRGSALADVAGLELTLEQQQSLLTEVDTPPWLAVRRNADLCARFASAPDVAWRGLCSPGWTYPQARARLEQLARHAGSTRLSALVAYWSTREHSGVGYGLEAPDVWFGTATRADLEALPAAVAYRTGHSHAPDARWGSQRVSLRADGRVSYERHQRDRRWRHELEIGTARYATIARMLAATPFPEVATHSFPPGSTISDLDVTDTRGRTTRATFDSTAAAVAVYSELTDALVELAMSCHDVASEQT